jgi:poly(3-hydroxybutyrate) depolymerase
MMGNAMPHAIIGHRRHEILIALGIFLVLFPCLARLETVSDSIEVAGIRVDFEVVLPDGYDPERAYPAVLAFPGGGQTMRNVERMLDSNWRAQAEQLGYIVISPAAPEPGLFFQGGDAVFPELLDLLLERYRIADGRFHVAGVSNGGASAFHVAAAYPGYFVSVTGLPGYLPYLDDAKIEALATLCIYMHVGERDEDWITTMAWQAQRLTDSGASVRFWIEKGQGHIMNTLAGAGAARLFEHLREAETGCRQ